MARISVDNIFKKMHYLTLALLDDCGKVTTLTVNNF